jgi:hypothetical protein
MVTCLLPRVRPGLLTEERGLPTEILAYLRKASVG